MALILSIPEKVQAETTYYSYGDHEITYNNYLYGFYITSDPAYDLPSDYKISSEVFEDIISSDAKGLQFDLANRIDTFGIKILDWTANGIDSYLNFIFGTFVNAYQATNSFVHDFIWSGAATYSWNYHFTGADPNYPGSGDYGTAYGFRFIGAGGEKFDVVLDANGDYYGHSLIGNWTPSEDPAPTNWILINQGLDNFYTPSISINPFDNLKPPYIEGKELHFFITQSNVESEYIFNDFRDMQICFSYTNNYYIWIYFYYLSSNPLNLSNYALTKDGSPVTLAGHSGVYITDWRFKQHNGYLSGIGTSGSISGPSVNLPGALITNSTTRRNDTLGFVSGARKVGFSDIFLKGFSYTPQSNPQPFPEEPVPITSIPEDPDDPIPESDPDPVPGIEYPVNPTPYPLRPVPSIVSGNDDLWPTVIQLQDIEFDLSGYLSGLGDYSFPDLSVITESFAGSIMWVSVLMSTLFNGSDFSILFAVLSSFFIVAALLGLYKWWNHK